MILTLRTRLAGISAIVFGLLLTVLSVVSYQLLAMDLDNDVSERLTELSDGLHGYLAVDGNGASIVFDDEDSDQAAFVHEATRYYQVFDAKTGLLLAESPGFAIAGLGLTPAEVQAYRARLQPFDISTPYGRLRVSNSEATTKEGRTYLLQVGVSLAPTDATLAHYRNLLLWRVPLTLMVAVLTSWWLSAFALRPLSQMAAAASQIDVKSLERRLPLRGAHDELDQVGHAFNETLGRLEHAVGEMRQFGAALAHELRTPLAALRGEIELTLRMPETTDAQQSAFASEIEEIDKLTRLIDRILTLARAESGQLRFTLAPVDLGLVAASIVDQIESIAEARSIAVCCERSDDVIVNGDRAWLERLLLNLLDNAIKFTRAHGRIVVRVSREGDLARIDVQDTGIGLSPVDAERVFERFFRADPARTSSIQGSGLGLSLVQWIAAQHHGVVTVQSRLGEGSTFSVTLPIARTSPQEH